MKTLSKQESMDMWAEIKEYHNCKTTEELLGIDEVIQHQCSFIDEIKDKIGSIEKQAEVNRKETDDLEALSDKLFYIRHDVYGLEDDVEKLRNAIENVREWGSQWKNLCKKIILKYEIDVTEKI